MRLSQELNLFICHKDLERSPSASRAFNAAGFPSKHFEGGTRRLKTLSPEKLVTEIPSYALVSLFKDPEDGPVSTVVLAVVFTLVPPFDPLPKSELTRSAVDVPVLEPNGLKFMELLVGGGNDPAPVSAPQPGDVLDAASAVLVALLIESPVLPAPAAQGS